MEIAIKEAHRVCTASSVVYSGVTTLSPGTTLFELTRNTVCWRLKTFKITTLRKC